MCPFGGCSWGNPKDSVWEDWGTLGKIRGITTPPERILLHGVQQILQGSLYRQPKATMNAFKHCFIPRLLRFA